MKLSLILCMVFALSLNSFAARPKKKVTRKIANLKSSISKENKQIVEKLNSIVMSVSAHNDIKKTISDVERAVKEITALAAANPKSEIAQMYAEVVKHIPHFRGFVYRLRNLVEPSDFAYIMSITALRKWKQTGQFRAKYADALFDYFTDPNPKQEILGQKGYFKSVSEMQDWVLDKVTPKLVESVKNVKGIINGNALEKAYFEYKTELFIGKFLARNLRHEGDKSKLVLGTHILGGIAALESYLSYANWVGAYNFDSLAEFSNKLISRSYRAKKGSFARGWSALNKNSRIVSAAEIAMLLKSKKHFGPNSKHAEFLTLRDNGMKRLAESKKYLKISIEDSLSYHNSMMDLARTIDLPEELFIDPELYDKVQGLQQRVTGGQMRFDTAEALRNSLALVESEGAMKVKDRVLDRYYSLNVNKLFDGSMKDLRVFFPNKFDESKPEKSGKAPGLFSSMFSSKKKEEYQQSFKWNYGYGKMLGWKDDTFGGLIPNGKGNDTEAEYLVRLTSIATLPETPYLGAFLAYFISY
jgi:hypothetical protein